MQDFASISVKEACIRSRNLMQGNKLTLLLTYLSFIPIYIVGVLSFMVGVYFIHPYVKMTLTEFYLDRVKKNKLSVIPSDGWILTAVNAGFNDGESVFDVTKRVCMENKIPFEFTLAPIYNTAYIEGINNIYEFDCGSTSGWLYKVNGEFKSYGCSDCKLNNGDIIEWVYTCDLGKDVGNEYKE